MSGHTTATRLSISKLSPTAGYFRTFGPAPLPSPSLHSKRDPFYHETPASKSLFKIRSFLPRWARSLRGLVALFFLALFGLVYLTAHYHVDPALRQARLEAKMAEMALRDPTDAYHQRFAATGTASKQRGAKWTQRLLSWPTLALKSSSSPSKRARSLVEFPPQGAHLFHNSGVMIANPEAQEHPIATLIEKAEHEWKALQAKQSKTLAQVTTEYKKRYRRNPPKGFEKWWNYAQQNRVLLPDEYDQINADLAPFWAIEPRDLKHRAQVMQDRPHTFTLVIQQGTVSIEGPFAHIRRASDIADIIGRFAKDLPHDLNMTFIMDDQPAVLLQHEQKSRMMELANLGEYFGPSDESVESDDSSDVALSNYARACAPTSPLRKQENGFKPSELTQHIRSARSFIHDPKAASDVCLHPEIKQLHGHTVVKGTEPTPLVPLFTWAKMSTHSDILVTPLEQYWDEYEGYDPPFSKKSKNKLLWRGSTTGADFTTSSPWKLSQRARLHFMTKETNGTRDILFTDKDGHLQTKAYSARDLNEHYMDTSFSGRPAQCDAATCEYMRKTIDFAETQGLEESYQYKYMIDVDGNAWSGRFHRLMTTKSLVLKSTVFPEWYADRLIPWYHYVPVKVDYSDLYDIMAFFAGTPDGQGAHEVLAERIAENGRRWAMRYWRRSDMASYMYRLILEYSRLLHQEETL